MTTKVVILNWNGEQHLARFLPSVTAATPPEVGIVVADNGSTDGSLRLLAESFPQVEVVRLDRNYGFAGGYNRALRSIEADIFILLNSDVHTPEGWCGPLIEALEADPHLGAVSPKILSLNEPQMFEYAGACGGFIDALGFPFCRGRIMDTVERDSGQYDTPREVFWASGACFACRSEVFRLAGGFDESFFAHQEEIDLCWRMQRAGYRIEVRPQARVYHLGGGTLAPSPRKTLLNYRNNLCMLYKNLPAAQLPVTLPVRLLCDAAAAAIFLLGRRGGNAMAVCRAWCEFLKRLPQLRISRRELKALCTGRSSQIYRGSIVLRHAVGRRTFGNMM